MSRTGGVPLTSRAAVGVPSALPEAKDPAALGGRRGVFQVTYLTWGICEATEK